MACAFERLFGVPDAFRDTPMPGRTDAQILADALSRHRVRTADPCAFRDLYLAQLVVELEKPGSRKAIMPGVRELLDRLSLAADVYLGLLSGNFEQAAHTKLEHFDLWRYFRAGAFGDEALNRNDLLAMALTRIRDSGGPLFAPCDAVVIGDTPLDIACAAFSGARSLAVATGGYDVATLRASGADVVFADLSDTEAVLKALRAGPSKTASAG
jgi:phosphoglycolate phosphatase